MRVHGTCSSDCVSVLCLLNYLNHATSPVKQIENWKKVPMKNLYVI